MNFVRATHLLAMDMATLADVSKGKGALTDAQEFYKKAYELEKKAAFMTNPKDEDPDAHFILIRSAASLALTAGLFEEGLQLIQLGLSNNPPTWMQQELKEVAELIRKEMDNFSKEKKTMQLKGVLTEINSRNFEITLQEDRSEQSFFIVVPQNQFTEIVKKYWLNKVKIQVFKTQQGLFFLDRIAAA